MAANLRQFSYTDFWPFPLTLNVLSVSTWSCGLILLSFAVTNPNRLLCIPILSINRVLGVDVWLNDFST